MKYAVTVFILGGLSAMSIFCATMLSASKGGLQIRGPQKMYLDIWIERDAEKESLSK